MRVTSCSVLAGVALALAPAAGASSIAGRSVVRGGEFVYTDYLYDDAGRSSVNVAGDPTRPNHRGLANPSGKYVYPSDLSRCAANCADILEISFALRDGRTHVRLRMNTLVAPDSTVVGIAFGDEGTALREWPFGANLSTPGTQHVLTLWGTGGAWDTTPIGGVTVDLGTNTIEASVPAMQTFRAYAAAGLWDPDAHTWMALQPMNDATHPGGGFATDPRAFNVAFRPVEEGPWFETLQAQALASGDISAFHADVDLSAPDTPDGPLPSGIYERIYEAGAAPGEGVAPHGVRGRGTNHELSPTNIHYLGTHQPYVVSVPDGYERILLMLEGGGGTHTFIAGHPAYDELRDAAKAVLVSPLRRSPTGWYTDWSYLDVVEAYEDALRSYPDADPDRTAVWGYSMGGFGVNRMQTMDPDMVAAGIMWAAAPGLEENYTGDGNGNPVDLLENTGNVDVLMRHCAQDNRAPYAYMVPQMLRLEELGHAYAMRTHLGCDHVTLRQTLVDFTDDARAIERSRIDRTPGRVTYKAAEAWWRPDISPKLVFDGAYWVSGIRTRDTAAGLKAFGTVDAVTYGLGERAPSSSAFTPSVAAGPPYPFVEHGRHRDPAVPAEPRNAFDVTLANVRTASFDLEAMGLTLDEPLLIHATSDGPATLRLGDRTVAVDTGTHAIEVTP